MKNKYDLKVDVYTYLRDFGFKKWVIDDPQFFDDCFDKCASEEEKNIEIDFDIYNEEGEFPLYFDAYQYDMTEEEFYEAWDEVWNEFFPIGVEMFKKWLKDEGFKHEFIGGGGVRVYPYVRKNDKRLRRCV